MSHFPLPPGKMVRQLYNQPNTPSGQHDKPPPEPERRPLTRHEQVQKKCHDLREKLLHKFKDVFKVDLDPEDVINQEEDIRLDIDSSSNITPENVKTPISIPLHLRKAADEELRRALHSGWLEPVHHATGWSSRGMFVKKHTKPGETVKVSLVANFRGINKIL